MGTRWSLAVGLGVVAALWVAKLVSIPHLVAHHHLGGLGTLVATATYVAGGGYHQQPARWRRCHCASRQPG